MSDPSTLYQQIRSFVGTKIGAEIPEVADVELIKTGVIDSLSLVSLLADVEKEFGVFPDLMQHDPSDLTSLNKLSGVIFKELTGNDIPQPVSLSPDPNGPLATADRCGQFELMRLTPDHSLWLGLRPLFAEMYGHFSSVSNCLPLANSGEREWLEALEALPLKMAYVGGAIFDGRLSGFISARIKALPPFLGGQWIGEISHVFVQPELRRKGAASALASAALEWLQKSGVNNIELQVVEGNESAEKFWATKGFQLELSQYRMLPRSKAHDTETDLA